MLDDLVTAIRDAAGSRRAVVLIDGRSGSGKTVLGQSLAPSLDADLVSLDDLYPGWDGLAAGSDAVHETVLRVGDPGWVRWDWAESRPAEWHPVDPDRAIVIEGCGALSPANRALATFGVWLELGAEERRRRALDRDGESFAPHWDEWAGQEDEFIAREHPREPADLVIDEHPVDEESAERPTRE